MTHGRWNPEQDLTALLDALTDEVLATPESAFFESLHDIGEDRDETIAEMRGLVAESEIDSAVPSVVGFASRWSLAPGARVQ
jgi:predicted DNA-binding ribbon-helix-helix protein